MKNSLWMPFFLSDAVMGRVSEFLREVWIQGNDPENNDQIAQYACAYGIAQNGFQPLLECERGQKTDYKLQQSAFPGVRICEVDPASFHIETGCESQTCPAGLEAVSSFGGRKNSRMV